jgi:peptidyl-tRNA hydrolase, PTH1 family
LLAKLFAKITGKTEPDPQPDTEFDNNEDMSTLRMIVGLGNPGARYARNRHNIGFQCVDRFAQRHHIEVGRSQHNSLTGDGWIQKSGMRMKVLLVKPLTYMNRSGQAVSALANYYNVEPENLIVIHDDLDLEPARLRLRPGGGSGGQNGIKSIIQQLGYDDFHRVRVGIGRPEGYMDAAAYVLQDFSEGEEEHFAPLRDRVGDALECWLFEGIEAAMNRFNG